MTARVIEGIRSILRRTTQWNVDVGRGAIPKKQVYRYPSPAATPPGVVSISEDELRPEYVGSIKYTDKEAQMLKLARVTRLNNITDNPATDPRNFFGPKFEDLPGDFVPTRIIKMYPMVFNDQGIQVFASELEKDNATKK